MVKLILDGGAKHSGGAFIIQNVYSFTSTDHIFFAFVLKKVNPKNHPVG